MQTVELQRPVIIPSETEVQREILELNSRLNFLRRLKRLLKEQPGTTKTTPESLEASGANQ